jgi:hypothetical protein
VIPFLETAALRSERAQAHLDVLQGAVQQHLNQPDQLLAITNAFDPQANDFVFSAALKNPLPPHWGLWLGECTHQLRATLDNLVCQLVTRRHQQCTRSTQFPIYSSEEKFNKRAPIMLKGLDQPDIDFITSVQPWNPSAKTHGRALELLAFINNEDKHRLLHPSVAIVSTFGKKGSPIHVPLLVMTPEGKVDDLHDLPPEDVFSPNADAGKLLNVTYLDNTVNDSAPVEVIRVHVDPAGPNPQLKGFMPLVEVVFTERRVRLSEILLSGQNIVSIFATVSQIVDRFGPEFL